MYICCNSSKKTGNKYLVLVANGVYVCFDIMIIEKVAMTNGISNIDLNNLEIGDRIKIEEVN